MAHGLEREIDRGDSSCSTLLRPRRAQHPFAENLVEALDVFRVCRSLLDLKSIGSSGVLRLQASISQEDADEHLSLDVGESQSCLVRFDRSKTHGLLLRVKR